MKKLHLIFFLIFTVNLSFAVTTTWTGSSSVWWGTAGNWSNGVPTGSDDVIIPDVSGTSGNNPKFTGTGSDINCRNLTINSGATLTLSSTSKVLNVYGDIAVNGTIDGTNDMLRLFGTSKTISGAPTDVSTVTLYVRSGGSYTLNSNWSVDQLQTQDVNSTFNIASGVTLTANYVYNRNDCFLILLGTGALDVNGTCAVIPETRSTFTMNNGTLYCSSSLGGNTSATFNAGTGTVVLDGSTSTSINRAYSFYNLTIAKDATDDIVTCNDADDDINVTNNLVITEGTFQPTLATLDVAGTTTITDGELIGGSANITLGGNVTMDNDAFMTISASTSDIRLDANLTMNGTSGVRNTGGATKFIRFRGNSSNTISCNTPANSSSVRVVMGDASFNYTLNSNWQIAYLQLSNSGGAGATLAISDGNTLTVDGDINTYHTSINLTLNGAANLDCNGSLSTGSVVTINTGTLSIATNLTNTHTFTDGTGTVTFDGSANSVIDDPDGIEFYNLTLNKAATDDVVSCNDLDADITVANSLTITEGTLSTTAADLSVTGSTTIDDGKLIAGASNGATTLTGDLTMNNDAILDHQSDTIIQLYGSLDLNGTSSITTTTLTEAKLNLNGGTKTVSAEAGVNCSNLWLYFYEDYTINTDLTVSRLYPNHANAVLTVADGATLTASTIYNQTNGTVILNGSANMTITDQAWVCQTAGTSFTINTGTLDVENRLQLGSGTGIGTFNGNSGTIKIAGDLILAATMNHGSSKFELDGTSAQNISGTVVEVQNMEIKNTSGGVTISNDLAVKGALTLTSGVMTTGANTITLESSTASDLSGFSSSSFINGNLKRAWTSNTSTYAFPLGKGTSTSDYMLNEITNANLATTAYITGKFVSGATNTTSSELETCGENFSNPNLTDFALDQLSEVGYFNFEPNVAPTGGTYDMKMYTTNYIKTSWADNKIVILKRETGSTNDCDWDLGTASAGYPADGALGRMVADGYLIVTGLSSFSDFVPGGEDGSGGGALPITLVYFDAQYDNNSDNVHLSWATASEVNNDFFTIERSSDGMEWEIVTTVDGANNSTIYIDYGSLDEDPIPGLSYYRLKQTDFDGSFEYSDMVVVQTKENETNSLKIYPNPSSGEFYIKGLESISKKVIINTMLGQVVYSQTIENNRIDLSHLEKGIYFLIIDDQSEKIVIN